jgi:SAM-dependent methyltransferase
MQQHLDDPSLLKEMLVMDPRADAKVGRIAAALPLDKAHTLDVGFGMGLTMILLGKLGARVAGIDLDPDAVAFARIRLGIPDVHQCDLLEHMPTQPYDLITFHDLIEHPLQPMPLLMKAHSILAPGGVLSIWTPNGSDLMEEPDPIQLRVDLEHMQYPSFRTCRFIAQEVGFDVVHLESLGTPRLENIARLAGSNDGGWKKTVRRAIRNVPGFVKFNALRKKLASHDVRGGRYHLFCLLRRKEWAGDRYRRTGKSAK